MLRLIGADHIIDRRYPLEQIAEAHRSVDSEQKKGNAIFTLENA